MMARTTIYGNQLRFQSTLLVPLNLRMQMLNDVAQDDEDSEVCDVEDAEDDTL